ncbi:heptaprenyl diphosphate synthase component 1 [Peribacillus saganii]|uniref:Heptaprenyl diphosphate synthase component 1 n=1 Tax=Peribacillus saganii TaxID=2303992 RepID=A0A372LND6_9BACI|nr:heptaprenyl diphosphate synthase component 1 [Peribacillus saganii]RFU68499.1 heptaprenyl diphosphate synthase component 1 [Peribacillus saganii]
MLNSNKTLAELKDMIEAKTHHPYLLQFLEKPFIDENKLLLLLSIFEELDISPEERDKYILSAMLIQIALDTHEKVTNKAADEDSEGVLKNRQLTVLAGDYYSGLYYKLLADIENISLIRVLAEAIKEINEQKIVLYQRTINEISDLTDSLAAIESSLIRKIADSFQKPKWKEFSSSFLLLNRLIEEKNKYMESGQSVIFDILKKLSFPKRDKSKELSPDQRKYVLNKIDHCINQAREATFLALDRLSPDGDLQRKLASFIAGNIGTPNSLVEEG